MKKIRKDSTAVNVYNDGLVVFLYDEANSEAIQKANPTLLEAFSYENAADPKLAGLANKGLLVAYELQQDDELSIEIAIGNPMTDEESQKSRWHAVKQAPIHLPSGKLCIEGYGNFRLSPDYDPDEEPGAVVKVPPGDYVLSLYHLDWERLGKDGLWNDEMEEDWEGAGQVIILTPAADAEPVANPAPMLTFSS
jgi:hypothetical protein